jgi:hypothetical protein
LSVNCGMFVVVSRYFLFPPPIKLTSAKWLKYCFLCVCLRMVMSIILSYQMFIRSEFRVVMSATMFRSSLSPVVWGLVSYLHYLCLFAYSGVQHILRCGFFSLSSSCVLCTQCCQFLWIVHFWLPLRFSLTVIF